MTLTDTDIRTIAEAVADRVLTRLRQPQVERLDDGARVRLAGVLGAARGPLQDGTLRHWMTLDGGQRVQLIVPPHLEDASRHAFTARERVRVAGIVLRDGASDPEVFIEDIATLGAEPRGGGGRQ